MANTTEQALNFARDLEVAALKGVSPPPNWTSEAVRHIQALTAASAEEATPVAWTHPERLQRVADGKVETMWPESMRLEGDVPVYLAAPQASQPIGQPELAMFQPCGCIVCRCEDEVQCHGCGAKNCGTHPVGEIPNPVYASNSQPVSGAGMTDSDISDLIAIAQYLQTVKHWEAQEGSKRLAEITKKLLSASGQAGRGEKAAMWADALNARADWEENTTKLATPGTIKLMRDVSEFLSSNPAQQTEAPVSVPSVANAGGLPVIFQGVDPLAIGVGATQPMIPDSRRFGFYRSDAGLHFGFQDNGPLVAWEAVQHAVAMADMIRCARAALVTETGAIPYGYAAESCDGHITFFKQKPAGFDAPDWRGLMKVVELYDRPTAAAAPAPAQTEAQQSEKESGNV